MPRGRFRPRSRRPADSSRRSSAKTEATRRRVFDFLAPAGSQASAFPLVFHTAGIRSARPAKPPPQRDSIPCENPVKCVKEPPKYRPTGRCQQPSQTDCPVSLPEHLHLAHDASVWKDAVNDFHHPLPRHTVSCRVEAWSSDILERQVTMAIPALQPSHLAPAEWAPAIIQ